MLGIVGWKVWSNLGSWWLHWGSLTHPWAVLLLVCCRERTKFLPCLKMLMAGFFLFLFAVLGIKSKVPYHWATFPFLFGDRALSSFFLFSFFCVCLPSFFAIVGMEPNTSCMLGKCFTTELCPSPYSWIFKNIYKQWLRWRTKSRQYARVGHILRGPHRLFRPLSSVLVPTPTYFTQCIVTKASDRGQQLMKSAR